MKFAELDTAEEVVEEEDIVQLPEVGRSNVSVISSV
jgi:hypothetical protein